MGLGVPELVVIFLIIVVLFGASRLPQLGRGLGEGISNFKKGLESGKESGDSIPESAGHAAGDDKNEKNP